MSISLNPVPAITVTPAPDFSGLNAQVTAYKKLVDKELKEKNSELLGRFATVEDIKVALDDGTLLYQGEALTDADFAVFHDQGYFIVGGSDRYWVVPTDRANAEELVGYTEFKLLRTGAGAEIDAIEARLGLAEDNITLLETNANEVSSQLQNASDEMIAIRFIAENNKARIDEFTQP